MRNAYSEMLETRRRKSKLWTWELELDLTKNLNLKRCLIRKTQENLCRIRFMMHLPNRYLY